METESLSPEKIEQIKDILKELDVNQANQALIQDNKLIFTKDEKVYRCCMPTQLQQTEAENKQNQLKVQLIQSDNTITRKRLIQVLKEKQDIDINQLEKDKEKLQKDLQDVYLEMAVVPTDNSDKIEEKFMEISIEIVNMIESCIEEQTKIIYYRYLASTCTEKQIKEDKFEKVWDNYIAFENDDTGLSYKAIEAVQTLLLSTRE